MGFDRVGMGFNFGEYEGLSVTLQQTKTRIIMQEELIKEEVMYVVDSLGVAQPETFEKPAFSLVTKFVEGGLPGMIVITLFLIALLLAAWKAPRWVKEIGIGALVAGLFWMLSGLSQVLDVMHRFGDISPAVLCGGLKVTLIPLFYGLIVYFLSLIIRIIHKPRI